MSQTSSLSPTLTGTETRLKKTIEWRPRQADWASPSSLRVFMAPKVRWGGVGEGCWTGERQGAWEGGQQGGQRGDRLRHHWPLYKPVGQLGHFIFGTFSNEKVFSVTVNHHQSTTNFFQKWAKLRKKCQKIKTSTIKSEKEYFFWEFLPYFCIFPDFLKI